jgi:hypothetical protein
VRDLGDVPDAWVFRTPVDWYVGFAVLHPRAAGRLHGITPPAAMTAAAGRRTWPLSHR